MRSSEWLLIGYFSYVALISARFYLPPGVGLLPLLVAITVAALLAVLVYGESRGSQKFFSIVRDWIPLVLMLMAYREMDWFTQPAADHHLELRWVEWDRSVLYGWGFQRGIEWIGALLPGYLEFCYLLVYAVGPFLVAVFYLERRRPGREPGVVPVSGGNLAGLRAIPVFSIPTPANTL